MKRLVYAPYVHAFIKSDEGVVDVSPYVVRGSVNRKINQVSSAQLTLRNPVSDRTYPPTGEVPGNMLWTEYTRKDGTVGPRFHPMDPIIILLTRLQGHPVQVFTGYLDKAPYIQLYPGLCSLEASCTLKRLLYTQWDAALPFVRYFLQQFGWTLNGDSGLVNPSAETQALDIQAGKLKGQFNDGSIGALLFAVMNMIGDWDHSTIWIEALPPQIKGIITDLYQQTSQEAQQGSSTFSSLIEQILGTSSQGSGGPNGAQPTTGDGWIKVGATDYNDAPPGAGNLRGAGYHFAELGTARRTDGAATGKGWIAKALGMSGELPMGFKLDISYNGKMITADKQDRGYGQGGDGITSDSNFAIDLYDGSAYGLANAKADLGFDGKGALQIRPHKDGSGGNASSLAPAAAAQSAINSIVTAVGGNSPGGKSGQPTTTGTGQYVAPFAGVSGIQLARSDEGVDFLAADGTPIFAIGNGSVVDFVPGGFDGDLLLYKLTDGDHAGMQIYVAEGIRLAPGITKGASVTAGKPVAFFNQSNSPCSTPCIETGFWENGRPYKNTIAPGNSCAGQVYNRACDGQTTIGGWEFTNFLNSLGQKTMQTAPAGYGGGSATGGGTAAGGGASTTGTNTAMAAAFSTFINLPSIFDTAEALAFTGKRSFMADQPLFPFIEQLCQASLRNFMSMPNGNFFAFFPDYFGLFGRKYYWEIRDIEIIDGRIDLSDDPLITHVAVAGDVTQYHGQVDVFDMLLTSGIFTVFDALATGYIGNVATHQVDLTDVAAVKATRTTTTDNPRSKQAALAFLRKYGARPYVEQAPMIRSPFFELFLAFQRFMLLWSKQFQTAFELTFMPELFPGGLIALPDHHLQLYVEEVVHDFDYEQGFTTTVNLSSPSKLDKQSRPNVSAGLARNAALVAQTSVETVAQQVASSVAEVVRASARGLS